jgi:hypothetical protein
LPNPADERRKQARQEIDTELIKARKSTASIGKFERLLPNEKAGKRSRQQVCD